MQRVADAVAALMAAGGLIFAGWLSVGIYPLTPMLAQVMTGVTPPGATESVTDFAIRQGGAFVILLVVLFYYRRDYRDLTDFRKSQADVSLQHNKILIDVMREQSKSSAEMAAALRENNVIVHQAKNVIREVLPNRRESDIK